ncbi:uncharacterized protein M6G45_006269 [Spheniscus humboldti]
MAAGSPPEVISLVTEAMYPSKEAPKHWLLGSVPEAGLSGWTAYPVMFDGYGVLECISPFIHQEEFDLGSDLLLCFCLTITGPLTGPVVIIHLGCCGTAPCG